MVDVKTGGSWISCQIGARQHYSNPIALFQANVLKEFITDAWVDPECLFSQGLSLIQNPLSAKLRQRYNSELKGATISAFTASLINFELQQNAIGSFGWSRIIARNKWFQLKCLNRLRKINKSWHVSDTSKKLLTFSYGSLELLRFAKSKGWVTILEQIDVGPIGDEIIANVHKKYPEFGSTWKPAPPEYWDKWKEEISLSDYILVNSSWTKKCIIEAGIASEKIVLSPLNYSVADSAKDFHREYPLTFSRERPLRILFLGTLSLLKGMAAIIEAARLLRNEPIEFWLVGSSELPLGFLNDFPNSRWIGPVTRNDTAKYYKTADVFLFPTLCDGFGLTQLEAQSWKLPIIASTFCGEVVQDRYTGLLLEEVSGESIAEAITYLLCNPRHLEMYSKGLTNPSKSKLNTILSYLKSSE